MSKKNNDNKRQVWIDNIFYELREIKENTKRKKGFKNWVKNTSMQLSIWLSITSLIFSIGIFINTRIYNIKLNSLDISIVQLHEIEPSMPIAAFVSGFNYVRVLSDDLSAEYEKYGDKTVTQEAFFREKSYEKIKEGVLPSGDKERYTTLTVSSTSFEIKRNKESGYLKNVYLYAFDNDNNIYHQKVETVGDFNVIDTNIPTMVSSINTNIYGRQVNENERCKTNFDICYIHFLKIMNIYQNININSLFFVFEGYNQNFQIIPILFKETHFLDVTSQMTDEETNFKYSDLYREIPITAQDLYSSSTWYTLPQKFITNEVINYCRKNKNNIQMCIEINKYSDEEGYKNFKEWYQEDTIKKYEKVKDMIDKTKL